MIKLESEQQFEELKKGYTVFEIHCWMVSRL